MDEDGMQQLYEEATSTAIEVAPIFKEGLEARTGGKVTITRVRVEAVSSKKDPYESTYSDPDENGCVEVTYRYTHTIVYNLVFEGTLELNGRIYRFRQRLKNYISTREHSGSYHSCPWDQEYATLIEYDGDEGFPMDQSELDSFLASLAKGGPKKA